MARRWYGSRQAYGPRSWITALLILVSCGAASAFGWLAPEMPLPLFVVVCLVLGVVPVQAQWMLWRHRHPIIATEPEVDPNLSYIEYLRLSYRSVAELNKAVERTDRLSFIVVALITGLLFGWAILTSFEATIAVVVAFMCGVHFATVLIHRRLRQHAFAQLKDSYQEIELQNIVEEGER
jgi:hypothetical protein